MKTSDRLLALGMADAYFLTSEENVSYVTGFSGDSSEVLVTRDEVYFFTDARYTKQAEKDIENAYIITTTAKERIPTIGDILFDNKINRLAIEKSAVTLQQFDAYDDVFDMDEYIDVSDELLQMRAIKQPEELEKIRFAAAGNEKALQALLPNIKIGMRELDIRAELIYQINKQGMDCAFAPIVAAGENSALPHATVSDYKIQSGDLLTLDFGCRYQGYCSDMTRTFAVGNIDEKRKRIYDIVKIAQQTALDAVQQGADAKGIDAAARNYITDAGYGDYYQHGTGHGVGLEIHERPVLNANSADVIVEDMVYTIEPGIYIPGVGGVRIEDLCIGRQGNLYKFSKELIVIE